MLEGHSDSLLLEKTKASILTYTGWHQEFFFFNAVLSQTEIFRLSHIYLMKSTSTKTKSRCQICQFFNEIITGEIFQTFIYREPVGLRTRFFKAYNSPRVFFPTGSDYTQLSEN